jgi:hypothetical protein
VLALSFLIQGGFIAVSAILVKRGTSSGSPPSEGDPSISTIPANPGFPWIDLVPIGLLSFQAAGKVIASRILEYTGLPCVVLTTLYSDLISDPGLFTAGLYSNVQRNRRAGGAALYFVGAVVGGVAASTPMGFSGGLWMAAVMHFVIMGFWMSWWAENDTNSSDEE